MEKDSYLSQLLNYLQDNWKKTNGSQSYGIYGAPNSRVLEDIKTPNAGYQPVRNTDIYLNPQRNRDQYTSLNTLFHEAAHTEQPRLSSLFNFTNQMYKDLSAIDFPDYDWKNPTARGEEVLATLRAHEAMQSAGKTIYDTDMGQEVLTQLKQKYPNESETSLKKRLDKAMFPKQNFFYEGK